MTTAVENTRKTTRKSRVNPRYDDDDENRFDDLTFFVLRRRAVEAIFDNTDGHHYYRVDINRYRQRRGEG